MPGNYDTVDLVFTGPGDFLVDPTGDILASDMAAVPQVAPRPGVATYLVALTAIPLALQPIARYLLDVTASELGDWQYNPRAAGQPSSVKGMPNTEETGDAIKHNIANGLKVNGLVSESDLNVEVIPISKDRIFVKLGLKTQPTITNKMTDFIDLSLVYNLSFGGIDVVDS